jgi:phage N-6-adenine-methyltransferase
VTVPVQKPGKSKQDYETPPEFVSAVEKLLGTYFTMDLAADQANAKATRWYTKEDDALAHDWSWINGWCWLNPPFGRIAPWAKKCAEEGAKGVKIALLVPAAVGSNWYRDYVRNHAYVFDLEGRISFDGVAPYPKDCVLALYGTPFRGSAGWNWRSYVG